MYKSNFSLSIRSAGQHIGIIDMQGGLAASAETELFKSLAELSDQGAQVIVLGFNELTFINSSGIGLLVRMVMRAKRQEQQVLAFGLQEHLQRIFALTRLQEVIHVYETEAEALGTLAVEP